MKPRHFQLRLNCTYQGSNNEIDTLQLEVLKDNAWEELELGIRSPGFLLFINGLFSCQHLYMRTNCAERSLILQSARGELTIETDEFWRITDSNATFDAVLRSGQPTADDTSYILERMKNCPVSSNISERIPFNNTVRFSHYDH